MKIAASIRRIEYQWQISSNWQKMPDLQATCTPPCAGTGRDSPLESGQNWNRHPVAGALAEQIHERCDAAGISLLADNHCKSQRLNFGEGEYARE